MLLQRWKGEGLPCPSVKVGRSEDFATPRNEHGCHMDSGASGTTCQGVP